jgi:L-ascorbate metabolism protein UlaG (beta-lactamase superfamily)
LTYLNTSHAHPSGCELGVTWIGHATALIELDGLRLLTDPVLGRRVGPLRRVAPPVAPGVAERIDAVLLSHLHSDHADLPSLRRVGGTPRFIAPPAAAAWLRRRRFARVSALSTGSVSRIGDVEIRAIAASHDGRRMPRGPEAEAVGFLITSGCSVYFAGDTDLVPEMAELAGQVDVALIPVWGWGPRIGPGHLDPQRAAEAVATIRPRVAIPIHWGTLAPAWLRSRGHMLARPPRAFADAAARSAPEVDIRVLAPGERLTLDLRRDVVQAPRIEACDPRGARPQPRG